MRRLTWLALVLLHAGIVQGLAAQSVRGRVVDEATGDGIPGVFVALLDEAGNRGAAVLSDDDGAFLLRAPEPGLWQLRAERIGYGAVTSDPVRLDRIRSPFVDLRLPSEPIRIEGLRVEGERRCSLDPDEGPRTAVLWEEARKALSVAAWAEDVQAFRFELETFERRYGPDGRTLEWENTERRTGLGTRPYYALPVEELAEAGYIQREGSERVYYAPDAAGLLSDAFLDTHCFRPTADPETGRVGLHFEPVGERGVADIEGTFWLDDSTYALERLDFRYLDPEQVLATTRIGGEVEFEQVEGGGWIVRRWAIRMPVVEATPSEGGRLAAIREEGGRVTELEEATLRLPRRSDIASGAVEGLVWDRTRERPLGGAEVVLYATNRRTVSDPEGRFALDDVPVGTYSLRARHPRLEILGLAEVSADVGVRREETTEVRLETPGWRGVRLRRCARRLGHPIRDHAVIVGRVVDEVTEEAVGRVRVEARWMDGAEVVGDPTTAPGRWVETDEGGGFTICRAEPGLAALWAVVDGDTTDVVALPDLGSGDVVETEIRVRFEDPVTLYGRVRRASSGAPVRGVPVELRSDGRRTTTDSLGAFVFPDVPPGHHGVEVREPELGPLWEVVAVSGRTDVGLDVVVTDDVLSEYPLEVERLARARDELRGRLERARRIGPGELAEAVREAEDALGVVAALDLPELEAAGPASDAPVAVYVDGWRAQDAASLLAALASEWVVEVRVLGAAGPVRVVDEEGNEVGGPALLIRTR